ncbi:MAG: PRC-barrel domain protein [Methanobacterium sp. PtaB.Bin024]|nr:MAG: PRC-barrel domain protein [Methanobacterium sp. PtaB.Bin024]
MDLDWYETAKTGYKMVISMRLKEKIIGKEVVDINAMVIGNVKDVEVNFESKTLEAFIVGKGGILEGLGSSRNDIIVPLSMVVAVGDKIIVKSENQHL